jgi:hypothetical protein
MYLNILVMNGGCEGTAKEFRELFDTAEPKLTRIIPTLSPQCAPSRSLLTCRLPAEAEIGPALVHRERSEIDGRIFWPPGGSRRMKAIGFSAIAKKQTRNM